MSGDFFKATAQTRKAFNQFDEPSNPANNNAVATTPNNKGNAVAELTPIQKADKLIGAFEADLIALSDKDFARRLRVNTLNALRKDDGALLSALQTLKGRSSFKQAIFASAEMGLQIDGQEGCLVLYRGREGDLIQYQPMWQGLVEIAYRSGLVKSFDKGVYCENDEFEYDMGRIVRHKINFKQERGEVIGYWVRANLTNGGVIDVFKTKADIEKVKNVSKTKNFANSPWNSWYDEMAFKSCFRALCKELPKTEALNKALAVWDSDFDFSQKQASIEPKENPFLKATEKAKPAEPKKSELAEEAEDADFVAVNEEPNGEETEE